MPLEHIHEGIYLLSNVAFKVSARAELNLLSLNAKKTKAIAFLKPYAVGLFKKLGINDIAINSKGEQSPLWFKIY